jgi:hypothetical protein
MDVGTALFQGTTELAFPVIAELPVAVCHIVCLAANQSGLFVIAFRTVTMDAQGHGIAQQESFLRRYRAIAFHRVAMLL